MAFPARDPALRAECERLLADTDLPMYAIAEQLGIARGTVTTWNTRAGLRRPRGLSQLSPANWPLPRREALARLYYTPQIDPRDLAEALGCGRTAAPALFRACGLTGRRPTRAAPVIVPPEPPPPGAAGPLDAREAADAAAVRAALRAHAAAQIAAFDKALHGGGAAVVDSARVLRDLGGLKRLLDDLEPADLGGRDAAADPSADPSSQEAHRDPPPDLPALRAEIARRFERFAGRSLEPCLPPAPAGPAPAPP